MNIKTAHFTRHRPIDRVVNVEPGRRAEALRFISDSLAIFDEHFPNFPVLPGSFVLASAFATAGLLFEGEGWRVRQVDQASFRRPAQPGEILNIVTEVMDDRGRSETEGLRVKFTCRGIYDERPLANGVFTLCSEGIVHDA